MIEDARDRIGETLERAVPEGPLALLHCPSYPNVGDNAIWLGQREAIRSSGLLSPVYTCTVGSYEPEELRRRLPRGTILLSGGGNLGDLYPRHQRFRETVIQQFPEHRIVVLPQSVHFRSDEALDRARRVFASHPDFLLLVRTRRSLAVAREHFNVDVSLCPDMAFALGRLPRIGRRVGVRLLLLRRDRESGRTEESSGPAGEPRDECERLVDWHHGYRLPDTLPALWHYLRWRRLGPEGGHVRALADYLGSYWTRRAWARVAAGLEILSPSRSVITDRLHGHILALMAGIPHVALDNSYGKVHGYVETWTGSSGLVRTATSLEKARSLAEAIERAELGPPDEHGPRPSAAKRAMDRAARRRDR